MVCVSCGYTLYATVDILAHKGGISHFYMTSLLAHHFGAIYCLLVCICTHKYLPKAAIFLVCEINSIFLELRDVVIIYGI